MQLGILLYFMQSIVFVRAVDPSDEAAGGYPLGMHYYSPRV